MKGFIAALPHRHRFQKFLFFSLVICAVEPWVAVNASEVTLAWNPNSDNVAGYNLYYLSAANSTPVKVDAGSATQKRLPGLLPGMTYTFYATAYNAKGNESGPSESITYTIPGMHAGEDNLTRNPGNSIAISPELLLNNDYASFGGTMGVHRVIRSGNPKSNVIYAGGTIQYLAQSDLATPDWFTYIVTNSAYSATGRVNINMAFQPPGDGTGTTGGVRPRPPTLKLTTDPNGAQVHLIDATPGRDYRVQATTQMKEFPEWSDIGITRAGSDGTAVFNDAGGSAESAKFYRAVAHE